MLISVVYYHAHTSDLHLFPYTTLFRSHHRQRLDRRRQPDGIADHGLHLGDKVVPPPLECKRPQERFGRTGVAEDVMRHALDRKSTRLNSSHANISYAVFCLKKKNNNQT